MMLETEIDLTDLLMEDQLPRYRVRNVITNLLNYFLDVGTISVPLAIIIYVVLALNYQDLQHHTLIAFILMAIKAPILIIGYMCNVCRTETMKPIIYNIMYICVYAFGVGLSIYYIAVKTPNSLILNLLFFETLLNTLRFIYYTAINIVIEPRITLRIKHPVDLSKLIRFTFTEQELDNTCVICLDSYLINDKCVSLTCKHYFHEICIIPWLKQKGYNCPLCRNIT